MDDLLSLAVRVEAAQEPNQELDALIAVSLGAWPNTLEAEPSTVSADAWSVIERKPDGTKVDRFAPEPFTTSLDAAMTLVPEGWTFANLSESDRKGWWCELRRGHLSSYDTTAFGNQLENGSAALAICAAALRARANPEAMKQGER